MKKPTHHYSNSTYIWAGLLSIVLLIVLFLSISPTSVTGSTTPGIQSVFPASGPIAGNTTTSISGSNFTGATAVTFGGVNALNFTVVSANQITAITPPHSAGAMAVKVVTPVGSSILADSYTYTLPVTPTSPVITPTLVSSATATRSPASTPTVTVISTTPGATLTASTSTPGVTASSGPTITASTSTPGVTVSPIPSTTTTVTATVSPVVSPTVTSNPTPTASVTVSVTSSPVATAPVTATVTNSPVPTASARVTTTSSAGTTPTITSLPATISPGITPSPTVIPTITNSSQNPTIVVPTTSGPTPPFTTASASPDPDPAITTTVSPVPSFTPAMPATPITSLPSPTSTEVTPILTTPTPAALSVVVASPDFSYSGQLTGSTLKLKSSFSVTVDDLTGTGAGWHLLAKINPLSFGSSSIPVANHTIENVTISSVSGPVPRNTLHYPMTIPFVTGKIFSAAPGTSRGQTTLTFATQLLVPPEIQAGVYRVILDITIVAGP